MSKKRFSIEDIDEPDSPIFKKLTVRGTAATSAAAENVAPEADKSPMEAGVEAEKPARPEPKVKPKGQAVKQPKTGEFARSYLKAGIPRTLSTRVRDLCDRGGFTEEYALTWLLPKATQAMSDVDVKAMPSPLPAPDMMEPTQRKWLQVDTGVLEEFRATHDPLEAYSTADCLRHIYMAAFRAALDQLADKLNK
ncbi:hypothetical protein [Palleronia sp.]|uniref:hypothetical protein n=1 Tax=Palleronia sp. TaxID=1940284 RepID=UPI0035C7C2C5